MLPLKKLPLPSWLTLSVIISCWEAASQQVVLLLHAIASS
jgi:hypothetical protein